MDEAAITIILKGFIFERLIEPLRYWINDA